MEQFAVIGLGQFGLSLAAALAAGGKEVLAIDTAEDKVNAAAGIATHTVTADASDVSVLKTLDIAAFDAVIVCVGDLEASVLITLSLKEMNVQRVIVKAADERHRKVLEKIGADTVVQPEADMARKMASLLINRRLHDLMELNDSFSILEISVPASWGGKTVMELNIRQRFGVNIILVLTGGGKDAVLPGGATVLNENDDLVVGGSNRDIDKFVKATARLK